MTLPEWNLERQRAWTAFAAEIAGEPLGWVTLGTRQLHYRDGDDARHLKRIDWLLKAWESSEPIDPGKDLPPNDDWQLNTFGRTFRKFMGRIYVFAPMRDATAVLVTVIPPWKAGGWAPPAPLGDRGRRLKNLDFLRKMR